MPGLRTHMAMCEDAGKYLDEVENLLPGVGAALRDKEARWHFLAGSTFPDWVHIYDYVTRLTGRKYGEVAHWDLFAEVFLDYLKNRTGLSADFVMDFEQWSPQAKNLAALFLGCISHATQDVVWHFAGDSFYPYAPASHAFEKQGQAIANDGGFNVDLIGDILTKQERGWAPYEADVAWPYELLAKLRNATPKSRSDDPRSDDEKQESNLMLDLMLNFERGITGLVDSMLGGDLVGDLRLCHKLRGFYLKTMLGYYVDTSSLPSTPAGKWINTNWKRYPFGGFTSCVANGAVSVRAWYARLRGWYWFQQQSIRRSFTVDKPGWPEYRPYRGAADADIYSGSVDLNNGYGEYLTVGTSSGTDERRVLIRFDTGEISLSTPIRTAEIYLYLSEYRPVRYNFNEVPLVIEAFAVNKPWGERSQSSITTAATPAVPGEVTWRSASHAASPWQSPGCDAVPADRNAAPVASFSFDPQTAVSGWIRMDITKSVNQWVRDPASNNGLLLKAHALTGLASFYSSQALTGQAPADKGLQPPNGGDLVAYRPTLKIVPDLWPVFEKRTIEPYGGSEHLYGTDWHAPANWSLQGVVFRAPDARSDGAVPVYMLRRNVDAKVSRAQAYYRLSLDWRGDSRWSGDPNAIVFYAYPQHHGGAVPVYEFSASYQGFERFRYSLDFELGQGWNRGPIVFWVFQEEPKPVFEVFGKRVIRGKAGAPDVEVSPRSYRYSTAAFAINPDESGGWNGPEEFQDRYTSWQWSGIGFRAYQTPTSQPAVWNRPPYLGICSAVYEFQRDGPDNRRSWRYSANADAWPGRTQQPAFYAFAGGAETVSQYGSVPLYEWSFTVDSGEVFYRLLTLPALKEDGWSRGPIVCYVLP